MRTEFKYVRTAILSCALGFMVVNTGYADGYRNPPPTAEGIGKSGANMVFVDDASAIFYNPANLADLDSASAVLGLTLARSETTYTSGYPLPAVSPEDDWVALPNLFIGAPIGTNGLAVGLGISTPFGQGTTYNKNDLVNIPGFLLGVPPAIHEGTIALINFNPTVAYRINDSVSIAVGADLFYSTLNFKQFYPWSAIGPIPPFGTPPDQDVEADGDGYGFGGNAAITWNLTDKQKLALTYRSEVKVEYEGDLTVQPSGVPFPPLPLLNSSSFAMDITYPTEIGAGYGIVLAEDIRLEASLVWTEWSVNQSLNADLGVNGTLAVPQNWEDTFVYRIGGDWQLDENWNICAGYAFIENPIPNSTMAPVLPDADRHALSLGFGYTTGSHTFDAAYTFSIFDDVDISLAENRAFPGSYDIASDLLGLTYSYSF